MNSGFVKKMKNAIEEMNNASSKFSSSVFTEDIWYGTGADAAKNYLETKIDKKLDEPNKMLNNLISAIEEGNKAEDYKRQMNNLNKEDENYNANRSRLQTKIDECKRKVRNYCS